MPNETSNVYHDVKSQTCLYLILSGSINCKNYPLGYELTKKKNGTLIAFQHSLIPFPNTPSFLLDWPMGIWAPGRDCEEQVLYSSHPASPDLQPLDLNTVILTGDSAHSKLNGLKQ